MSRGTDNRPGEMVFTILLAVFSAVALWQAYLISGFKGLSQPGVFPMLAAATMLASGLFIIRDAANAAGKSRRSGEFFATVAPLRLVAMVALVGLYIALMPWLGFMLASGAFLFASFLYLWRRGVIVSAVLTVITLSCIYFIFRIVFQVVLPKGTLLAGLI